MKQSEKLKRDDQEATYGGGSTYGRSNPNYNPPMSAGQVAWRVGLFVLGAIVGALLANL